MEENLEMRLIQYYIQYYIKENEDSGSTLRWWRTTVDLKRSFGTKCAMTTNTNAQTQYITKHSVKLGKGSTYMGQLMEDVMNGERRWDQAVRLSTQCTNVTPCLLFPDAQSGGHNRSH